MADLIVGPMPDVRLSDADENELPLTSFHLVLIVEADPESYMLPPGDSGKLGEVLYGMFKRFETELDPDLPGKDISKQLKDGAETIIVWLKYEDDTVNYFDSFADTGIARINFILMDSEDTEQLEYYLKGVFTDHPDWRIAVMGAMFEDEVIFTANVAQSIGFSTSVLTRYCLSSQVFLNLDNLLEHDQWVRSAGRNDEEPFRSWFDDWMEEHGIDPDIDDDEDSETD